jgi:hypothetical protein
MYEEEDIVVRCGGRCFLLAFLCYLFIEFYGVRCFLNRLFSRPYIT